LTLTDRSVRPRTMPESHDAVVVEVVDEDDDEEEE
jgi:hypothetical protein